MDMYSVMANRIPAGIRKVIIDERLIDKAVNSEVTGTPMEYLFDVYEEFIDAMGEHDNWTCFKCREHILSEFKKLKPYLEQLVNGK